MSIFTSTPGYAGYYGPITGMGAVISFGRGRPSDGTGTSLDNGFLCDQYTINWARPANAKRFLNVKNPVAIVGYGNGTLTLTGLVGTYDGFQKLIGGSGSDNDVCSPLYCLIQASNHYKSCDSDVSSGNTGVDWECFNLLLSNIAVTGQVQDNGVLFQQANVTFTMGGLKPTAGASNDNAEGDNADEVSQ